MNVEDIIARTVEVYATCNSYQDEGEVESRIVGETRATDSLASANPFATAFVRPDSFRFDYWESGLGPMKMGLHYVAWSEGGKYCYWSLLPVGKPETFKSIRTVVTGPTGISRGSARRIPALLIPSAPLCTEYALLSSEAVGKEPCFVLRRVENDEAETVWIEKSSGLVRQVVEQTIVRRPESSRFPEVLHQWSSFRRAGRNRFPLGDAVLCATKTMYRPVLNSPILPERFAFDPNAELGMQES